MSLQGLANKGNMGHYCPMAARTGRIIDPDALRDILADKRWSLRELSRAANVAYRTLTYALNEDRPTVINLSTARAIEVAVDVPADRWSVKVGPTRPALSKAS